jgi:hypothetical protein
MTRTVHFVGFRGDEYSAAVRVWGKPDFIHRIWDVRAAAESGSEDDVVVFARAKDWENRGNPTEFSFDDSAVM